MMCVVKGTFQGLVCSFCLFGFFCLFCSALFVLFVLLVFFSLSFFAMQNSPWKDPPRDHLLEETSQPRLPTKVVLV